MDKATFQRFVEEICFEVADTIKAKNDAYGDSALNPIRVFSKADPVEQIRVRLDDKLSRIVRGSSEGEDVRLDLIGYLVLWEVYDRADREEKAKEFENGVKESTKKVRDAILRGEDPGTA